MHPAPEAAEIVYRMILLMREKLIVSSSAVLLSATDSLAKARIPLGRPNLKLIYSNAVHGFINPEAGGSRGGHHQAESWRGSLLSGRSTGQLCDLGHILLQVLPLNVEPE